MMDTAGCKPSLIVLIRVSIPSFNSEHLVLDKPYDESTINATLIDDGDAKHCCHFFV